VIAERRVLLRVEQLEESRQRISSPASSTSRDLIDLIDEDNRVLRTSDLESLDRLSRKSTEERWGRKETDASVSSLLIPRPPSLGPRTKQRSRKKSHSPNISPPMSLDLRHIPQPTHTDPVELPLQRSSDGLGDAGLSDSRRSDEADDLALNGSTEFPDGEELEDSILDGLETVMVGVEDGCGGRDGEGVDGVDSPGDGGDPFEVVSEDAVGRGE